jgi:hypothetical protein
LDASFDLQGIKTPTVWRGLKFLQPNALDRANRNVPQPGAREQSSCCGVRADAFSFGSAPSKINGCGLICLARTAA